MKKYDLYIPVGENCLATLFLKEKSLRKQGLPLDWITPVSLNTAIDLIESRFSGFLKEEDLEVVPRERQKIMLVVKNKSHGLYFLHDFYKDKAFHESFPRVKEKYQTRISRLYDKINDADSILFFHIHKCTENNTDDIAASFFRLKKLFNGKTVHLLFINSYSKDSPMFTIHNEPEGLTVCDCYNFVNDNTACATSFYPTISDAIDTSLEVNKIDKVLMACRNILPMLRKNSKIPIRILCWVIPSAKIRKQLRRFPNRNFV